MPMGTLEGVPAAPASPWRIAFDGRIPRLPYALVTLCLVAASYAVDALADVIAHETTRLGFAGTLFVLTLNVQLSFDVRRLHDLSLSGHAIWIGEILLLIIRLAVPGSGLLIQFFITWGWRILLAVIAGTRGDNEFGPGLRRPRE